MRRSCDQSFTIAEQFTSQLPQHEVTLEVDESADDRSAHKQGVMTFEGVPTHGEAKDHDNSSKHRAFLCLLFFFGALMVEGFGWSP